MLTPLDTVLYGGATGITVTVSSGTNYDLNADLQANYSWNGATSETVDVYITGALSGTAPFVTGADSSGAGENLTVVIYNQSTVRAAGGGGGAANSGTGVAGSNAFNISYDVSYDNSAGEISGGGTGGTAGALTPGDPGGPKEPSEPAVNGGGGGGGAGTPAGAAGSGNPAGAAGSATAGGAGGVSPGYNGAAGGARGVSGKAINLNGNTATDVGASTGTINGAIS